MADQKVGKDAVGLLLKRLEELKAEYFLDLEDRPCVRIESDSFKKDWRIRDQAGKPSERIRAWLRTEFHDASNRTKHLSLADLDMVLDYMAEFAFKGGRKNTRAAVRVEGNYNFEAVVAFAGTLTKDTPFVTVDEKTGALEYHAMTVDLWRAINEPAIEVQVTASKRTLDKVINWFSRHLTELKESFRKEGIDLMITRKETGSWVTIVRHDSVFYPGPVLLIPDDQIPSSSGIPSGRNSRSRNELKPSGATNSRTEKPKKEGKA